MARSLSQELAALGQGGYGAWKHVTLTPSECVLLARYIRADKCPTFIKHYFSGGVTQAVTRLQLASRMEASEFIRLLQED